MERVALYKNMWEDAVQTGNNSVRYLLADRADLFLRNVPAIELKRISKHVLRTGNRITDLIRLIKRVPFDGYESVILRALRKVTENDPPEQAFNKLYILKDAFPLIAGRFFDNWLSRMMTTGGFRMTPANCEFLIRKKNLLRPMYIKTPEGEDLMRSLREASNTPAFGTPIELVARGFWRTGLAAFLAHNPDYNQTIFLAEQLVDYPVALSQLLLTSDAIDLRTHDLGPGRTIIGKIFQSVIRQLRGLFRPASICQQADGLTIMLSPTLLDSFNSFDHGYRCDLVRSVISYFTMIEIDRLSACEHFEQQNSGRDMFNAIVTRFCNSFEDLYPGIWVDNLV